MLNYSSDYKSTLGSINNSHAALQFRPLNIFIKRGFEESPVLKRGNIGTNFEVETKLDGKSLSKKYVEHILTNKEASTVLCSVVKHAGIDRARKTSFSLLHECSTAS